MQSRRGFRRVVNKKVTYVYNQEEEMAELKLRNVRKSFGNVHVIHGIDLDIDDGEFVVFVGPSGCGKSTLLRLIAGLEDASGGMISIGDNDVTNIEPADRGVAMVFQSYALYPHMSVEENMGFGLKMTGTDRAVVRERVGKASRILHLDELLDRKPKQLSGGQRQRVAIGRAIVREPKVFLFDEPLSNLDAELRVQMRLEIAKLHKQLDSTMIYVTHDQVEAMTLADKIVVLRKGKIEQVGAPMKLYEDPDNLFVAGFIGSPQMNFARGKIEKVAKGSVTISVPSLGVKFDKKVTTGDRTVGSDVTIGMRPEHFNAAAAVKFKTAIDVVENLGGQAYAYAHGTDGTQLTVELRDGNGKVDGTTLTTGFDPGRTFLFDPSSNLRIR
jgi:lactose/L-arabinose transport system ATP-binding protein